MANTAHRTSARPKSKPDGTPKRLSVTTDKAARSKPPKRSYALVEKLVGLGVPRALAPDFPLTPHPTGRWCKKILGTLHIFGKVGGGWQAALDEYNRDREALFSGKPRPKATQPDALTLSVLCNRFLHFKRQRVTEGRMVLRSWDDYQQTCTRLANVLGGERPVAELGQDDFTKLAEHYSGQWGLVRSKNENIRVRSVFKWALKAKLIREPMDFGPSFDLPDQKEMRRLRSRHKAKHGLRMFEAAELRRIIEAADPCLKAMVLLAANGGLGNHDVATLPMSAVDLDAGWIDWARPKTGVERKVPLWPETVEAIKAWLSVRPEPRFEADADLVFLGKRRRAWFRAGELVDEEGTLKAKGISNPISAHFRRLMKKLELNGSRAFYSIRHGFETIAGDTADQVAVDAIMAHADPSMAAHYRERIDPTRLRRVVEHVRRWLFAKAGKGK